MSIGPLGWICGPPTPRWEWDPCCHDVGWRRSTEDAVHRCVRSPLLGVDSPGIWHRCAYSCTPEQAKVDDRQLDCVAQSGLVGSGLGSGLMNIGGLTLRRDGSLCRFLSLRLGLFQREWSHLVWPRGGLA